MIVVVGPDCNRGSHNEGGQQAYQDAHCQAQTNGEDRIQISVHQAAETYHGGNGGEHDGTSRSRHGAHHPFLCVALLFGKAIGEVQPVGHTERHKYGAERDNSGSDFTPPPTDDAIGNQDTVECWDTGDEHRPNTPMQRENHQCAEPDTKREYTPELMERALSDGLRHRHRAGQLHTAVGEPVGTAQSFTAPRDCLIRPLDDNGRVGVTANAKDNDRRVPDSVAVGVAQHLLHHRRRDIFDVVVDVTLAWNLVATQRTGKNRQILGIPHTIHGLLKKEGDAAALRRGPLFAVIDECVIRPGVARVQLLDDGRDAEREDDVVDGAGITRDNTGLVLLLNLPDKIQRPFQVVHLNQHRPQGDVGLIVQVPRIWRLDIDYDYVGRPVLAHLEQQRLLR